MKKMLLMVIVAIFMLARWESGDRHSATADMYLVTSFDFLRYPACGSTASSYCIEAIRFYDPDSRTRLAEVLVSPNATGPQSIVAHVNSIPHHVYAVTVYRDNGATSEEGLPGQVSSIEARP